MRVGCSGYQNLYIVMEHFNNDAVRRQDRLLDARSAEKLLQQGEYGVLSMVESKANITSGYGVPLNYVWNGDDKIYFHCAPEGVKLRCVDTNANVSFCVVGGTKVIPDKFTTGYESVVVRGRIVRNLPEGERMTALELLLDKYSPCDKEVGMKYAKNSFHRTEILRLEITHISGKTKQIGI